MAIDPESVSGTPEAPVPVSMRAANALQGLLNALLRAMSNAASSRTIFGLRDHVVVRQARKQIITPLIDTLNAAAQSVEAAKRELQNDPSRRLYDDVDPEQLALWVRNAQRAWLMAATLSVVASGFVALGASRGTGLIAFNTVLAGFCALLYSIALQIRAGRDLYMMTRREPISLGAYLSRIKELWLPLPAGHAGRTLAHFVLAPSAAACLFAAPLLWVMS